MVRDDVFHHGLCAAVRARRANGAMLGDGDHVLKAGRIAIHGGRAAEYNLCHIVTGHAAKERDGAADINAVVFERDFSRLANSLEGGKMDDAVDVGMRSENLVQFFLGRNVHLVEGRATSADDVNALQGDYRRIVEVIDQNDTKPILEEGEGGEGANVARSAGREMLELASTQSITIASGLLISPCGWNRIWTKAGASGRRIALRNRHKMLSPK